MWIIKIDTVIVVRALSRRHYNKAVESTEAKEHGILRVSIQRIISLQIIELLYLMNSYY